MLDFLRRWSNERTPSRGHPPEASDPVCEPETHLPTIGPLSGLPVDTDVAEVSLAAAPVHLVAREAQLRMENGALIIEKKSGDKIRRPVEHVSAIHIYGGGLISSAVVAELSVLGRPVIWRSHSGYPVSWNAPMAPAGLAARRNQYRLCESAPDRLAHNRKIISAKITNMRGLLRRRKALSADLAIRLDRQAKQAAQCRNENSLLGIEGAATRAYFSAFPALLKHKGKEQPFDGRNRRPPSDLANASMSYLYAVLLGECICAVSAAGLDPRCGILHKERAGRPALALDLMEPFRAVIVDACVTATLNAGSINNDHARREDNGLFLSDSGKRKALAAIEKRYAEAMTRPGQKTSKSWRDQIHFDALALADSFRNAVPFEPMRYP